MGKDRRPDQAQRCSGSIVIMPEQRCAWSGLQELSALNGTLIYNHRLKTGAALLSKLWAADHHFKQHRKPIIILLQRRFHFHQ